MTNQTEFSRFSPFCTRSISRICVTVLLISTVAVPINGFVENSLVTKTFNHACNPVNTDRSIQNNHDITIAPHGTRQTQLNVWWFGGNDDAGRRMDEEECELVAVRIERPTSNSRQIAGNIIVQRPVEDVWAILTDYDNLSIHVPNLVESRQVNPSMLTEPGDGSHKCRLYQKGAQKIVGFDFRASVTMDMTESIQMVETPNEIRQIGFKCVDSQFFSVFDGYWKVSPTIDPEDPSVPATKVDYVVLVKPKGPVPVAALEWRIREDVPTNLRAVKLASLDLGYDGVQELREKLRNERNGRVPRAGSVGNNMNNINRLKSAASATTKNVGDKLEAAVASASSAALDRRMPQRQLSPVRVSWAEDETMAAYLKNKRS